MVENAKDQKVDSSQDEKKYVFEWRNKYLTSHAETIDDFIKVFEHQTDTLKRWKGKGIELDSDVLSRTDDYAQFSTYNEVVAFNEGFEEETFEEEIQELKSKMFEDWPDPQEVSFIINEHLTVKMIDDFIQIFVDNKPFRHCKFLFIVDPLRNEHQEEISSIDEAGHLYNNDLEKKVTPEEIGLTKEQEFWGHCSNLQAWAENDYDSRLLHSNLAFPLLRKLTEVGDTKAKKVYKDEIGMRFVSGFIPVMRFLFRERFVDELTREEFSVLLDELDYTKFDLDKLLRDIYDLQESEYGYLFLSRIREEFPKTLSKERRYVEIAAHLLDKSQFCPIVFTYNEPHFIRGSNDGKLKEFDLITGYLLRTFGRHPERIRTLTISSDEKYVASSSGKEVNVWDYKTGALLHSFEGHKDYVDSLVFHPNGRYVLSGANGGRGRDCSIKIWDLKEEMPFTSLDSHWRMITSLSFSSDGNYMVSSAGDRTINVWDAKTYELLTTLIGHKGWIYQAAVTNNDMVVSASSDKTIKIWDIDTGKIIREIDTSIFDTESVPEKKYYIVSCLVTPDHKFIVAGLQVPQKRYMGLLAVWRFSDGKLVQKIPFRQDYGEHYEVLKHLTMSVQGSYIIGSSRNSVVKVWAEFMLYMEILEGVHKQFRI